VEDPLTPLEIRPGAALPGGTYRLGAQRHEQLLASLGDSAPADGSAHPLCAWVIGLGGCGVSIGDLFAAAGVPMEDGPMLGACDLELHKPLGIETLYTLTAEIVSVEQKSGRKLGRFDVMTMRVDAADPAGELAATCTASMILPRPREVAS
jgi:hypothetical protein